MVQAVAVATEDQFLKTAVDPVAMAMAIDFVREAQVAQQNGLSAFQAKLFRRFPKDFLSFLEGCQDVSGLHAVEPKPQLKHSSAA